MSRAFRIRARFLAALATLVLAQVAPAVVLDACDSLERWSAHPADGVELALAIDEGALRLDFHIAGGGYAVARLTTQLVLPENYAIRFRVRGEAKPNHLEFKLVDAAGSSVWWSVRRDFEFSPQWQRLSVKKRHLSFAWGPAGGGELREISAIELAITAGQGGEGQVWIDELELVELAPQTVEAFTPRLEASSQLGANAASYAGDGDSQSAWIATAEDREPWIALDLGSLREYSGLRVDWSAQRHAADYVLEASEDGSNWVELRTVLHSNGGRDFHFLGEAESRHLRLRVLRAAGTASVALDELSLQPIDWAESKLEFFQQIARASARGDYPRGMRDEQSYWTVVGVDFDPREALLSEDGALEVGRGRYSIEPFLLVAGQRRSWADARIEQSLVDEFLPMPRVHWRMDDLTLTITAFATGDPGLSSIVLRYEVHNRSAAPIAATLALLVRPFQVNPPSQTLNLAGGIAPIHAIARRERIVEVDAEPALLTLTAPSRFAAASFDAGDIAADYLAHGLWPEREAASDEFGAASAALGYEFELAGGRSRTIHLLVSLDPQRPLPNVDARRSEAWAEKAFARARQAWRQRLARVDIQIAGAEDVVSTLRSQLGYLLVNRAGPAIQPGTRSYARSWIRDGALSSWALLRCGENEAARQFLEWYAPHQFESGKIPCVVDSRGADPVPEHDSHGEFLFLVAEIYRHSRDRTWLGTLWPRVRDAAAYLDQLRQERRTEEYQRPENRAYFGILPPSISHEGYSAKPMHSYWDDFFALRGFADAAFVAHELGHSEDARRLDAWTKEFAHDLGASVQAAIALHAIDFVPGCADLGDFDATSTTIAFAPTEAASVLPEPALEQTFERYWEFFCARRDGAAWEAFTPYEWRNVGAFVRLGWRERAGELLDWFLAQRQPAGWRQWPEVVSFERRQPRYLGDMPHGWVGSDYMRSVLDMLEHFRARDQAIVLAAGVQAAWLEGPGVVVKNLTVSAGSLDYRLRRRNGRIEAEIHGQLELPSGGIVLCAPGLSAQSTAKLNGKTVALEPGGELRLHRLPARIVLTP